MNIENTVMNMLFDIFINLDDTENNFNYVKDSHPNRFERIIKRVEHIEFNQFSSIFNLNNKEQKLGERIVECFNMLYSDMRTYSTLLCYVFDIWKEGDFTKEIFESAKKLYIERNQKCIDFLDKLTYSDYLKLKENEK